MNATIAQRLTAAVAATVASTFTLGAVVVLFATSAQAADLEKGRMPGGAGVAERYRSMQPTANDALLAPRAGVTQFRTASPAASL